MERKIDLLPNYLRRLKWRGISFVKSSNKREDFLKSLKKEESSSLFADIRSLAKLKEDAANCFKCKIGKKRKNVVFGKGNKKADLIFIGEAPGEREDEKGEPFVGRAGELLTKMIEAMKLSREDIYISNIIKCRPEGNRNPREDEIANCIAYIEREIELVNPKIITLLGKVASQSILKSDASIGSLRGKVYEKDERKIVVTYHPAYLLRNPNAKKDAWADLQLVMKHL